MEVKNSNNGKTGVFYIEENGQVLANMYFSFKDDDKIIIEHTEVKPENEGKGLGKKLVEACVEYARKNDYKIVPVCSYAKSVFDKTEAYKDVLF